MPLTLTDPQNLNAYSYSEDNPITRSDPDGKFVPLLLGALAMFFTGADVESPNAVVNPSQTDYNNYRNAQAGLLIAGFASPGSGEEYAAQDVVKVSPQILGKAGEMVAGISQDAKQVVQINGRLRIPDAINESQIVEVKNVATQGMTRQLRDTIDLGKAMNKQPFLYMREGAHMTQPVVNAIKNGTLAGASLLKSALNNTVKTLINGKK